MLTYGSINIHNFTLKNCLSQPLSVEPDEVPHYAAFHLGFVLFAKVPTVNPV